MRRNFFVPLVVSGALYGAIPAQAAPTILKPASKWVVNYADTGCRLARQFGEGNDSVVLAFNRYSPSENFQLMIAGKPAGKLTGTEKLIVQFGPDIGEQSLSYQAGQLGKVPALIFSYARIAPFEAARIKTDDGSELWEQAPVVTPEKLAAISYVSFKKKQGEPLILQSGALEKPLAALSACVDNLVQSWGFDPVKDKQNQTRPVPASNAAQWLGPDDYPTEMLAQGQPALIQFRLNVDAQGKVTGCFIQATTRPKEFDDAVCNAMMRRARFKPALDSNGIPVASFWMRSVVFQIP